MAKTLSIDDPIQIQTDVSWKTAKIFLMGFFVGEVFLLALLGSVL